MIQFLKKLVKSNVHCQWVGFCNGSVNTIKFKLIVKLLY